MLTYLGVESRIRSDTTIIASADRLILPILGNFQYGMKQLQEIELDEVLKMELFVIKRRILCICLGIKPLTNNCGEDNVQGLGFIDAQTNKFKI